MSSFTSAPIGPAPEEYLRALSLYDSERFDEAASLFDSLSACPDGRIARLARFYAAESYAQSARECLGAGKFDQAILAFKSALEYAPNFADLHLGLARAHGELGEEAAAQASVSRALQLNPTYVDALLASAALALFQGDNAAAEAALETACQADSQLYPIVQELGGLPGREGAKRLWALRSPGNASVRKLMDHALEAFAAGQYQAAASGLGEVLRLCPTYPDVHFKLAQAQMSLNNVAEAESSLREAIAINPRFVVALSSLGALLYQQGRGAEGDEFIARALELDPYHPMALQRAISRIGRRSNR